MDKHPIAYISCAFLAGTAVSILVQYALTNRIRSQKSCEKSTSREKGDHGYDSRSVNAARKNIANGIESCIGNTPLIRIKSLSEATGCDILAKAEVELGQLPCSGYNSSQGYSVPKWRWQYPEG